MGARVKIRRYSIHIWFGLLISPAHSVSWFSLCFLCCLLCLFVYVIYQVYYYVLRHIKSLLVVYSLFSVLIFLPSSFVNELRQLQMFPIWQHLRPRLCSWAVSLGEACKQGCPGSASLFVLLCSLKVTGRRRGEAEPVLRLIRALIHTLKRKGVGCSWCVCVCVCVQLGTASFLSCQATVRRKFLHQYLSMSWNPS